MSNTDHKTTYIFLDIETLPTQDAETQARVAASLKAPANYKKPEVIAQWLEDNKETAVRKTSLSGLYGNVLCIGIAIGEEEPEVLTGDEPAVLKQLAEKLEGIAHPMFVGHYVREFDIKFLIQRQMINGMEPLFHYADPYYQRPILDTMEIFCVNPRDSVSLDNLCYALNVPTPKGDLDGSKVYDYWLAGKHQEIYDYCKDDVIATRECFKKMSPHSLGR